MNIKEILENTELKDLQNQLELLKDQTDKQSILIKQLIEIELKYRNRL